VKEVGLCVHVPGAAVNVWPTRAVPEIVGTAEFVGMMSMTAAVGALFTTALVPPEFVATTKISRMSPTSAEVGT
jgi:hypothetical protein